MAWLAGNADLAAVGFDDCFGNRQAHACALNLQALISTAIELFEYQGLFEIVDAWSAVGDAGHYHPVPDFSCDLNRRLGRRILGCVFQQLGYDFRDAVFIHSDQRQVAGQSDIDGMLSQGRLRFFQCGLDGFLDRARLQVKLELVGVELRHLGGFAHQAIQAVTFLVDHGEKFEALSRVQSGIGEQRSG